MKGYLAPNVPLAARETELTRRLLWSGQASGDLPKDALTLDQQRAMGTFVAHPDCAELREEARYMTDFRAAWRAAPYPPVFVTTDALVCWREQLLLVRRGLRPGKGLWALPGGFIDAGETLAACVRREVEEETGLTLDADAGRTVRVFDAPQRSLRGRIITHVFHFELDGDAAQPSVRGGDDAELARWFERGAIEPQTLFEDHYAILQAMLGLD